MKFWLESKKSHVKDVIILMKIMSQFNERQFLV